MKRNFKGSQRDIRMQMVVRRQDKMKELRARARKLILDKRRGAAGVRTGLLKIEAEEMEVLE